MTDAWLDAHGLNGHRQNAHGQDGHRQPCGCTCGRCTCTPPALMTAEARAALRATLLAFAADVMSITHHANDGPTRLTNLTLLCSYHHQVCTHRLGWTLTLHPDGTAQARSPDGQVLHSHAPPTTRAG